MRAGFVALYPDASQGIHGLPDGHGDSHDRRFLRSGPRSVFLLLGSDAHPNGLANWHLGRSALGEVAKQRLAILRETDDGFRIAEEDLRLRGAGEVLGTRQSGLPEFRLADLLAHAPLVQTARDDARLVLHRDPELTSPRGQALRLLLDLFERDAAARYLRSG